MKRTAARTFNSISQRQYIAYDILGLTYPDSLTVINKGLAFAKLSKTCIVATSDGVIFGVYLPEGDVRRFHFSFSHRQELTQETALEFIEKALLIFKGKRATRVVEILEQYNPGNTWKLID